MESDEDDEDWGDGLGGEDTSADGKSCACCHRCGTCGCGVAVNGYGIFESDCGDGEESSE